MVNWDNLSRNSLDPRGNFLHTGTVADKTPWFGAVQLEQLSEEFSRLRLMSESSQREMETSLCRHGQLTALIGCRNEGGLAVVDGFKRLRAARNLGWTEMRVEVHDAHGVAAKMFLWQSNWP